MKTLYVTDLDGTLLNSEKRIPAESLHILNRLIEHGLLFTYATARSIVTATRVTEGLKNHLPVITSNGSVLIMPDNREVLHYAKFERDEVETIVRLLQKHSVYPMVSSYLDQREKISWLDGKETKGIAEFLSERKNDIRLRKTVCEEDLYAGDVFYFTCIDEREALTPLYLELKEAGFESLLHQDIYHPEYWCEVMPGQATKSNAIKRLKNMLGCDRVVVFGDGMNDISMFQQADECYAVKNAVSELKEISTGVIESNEDNGVAKWLLERFQEQ